MYVTNAWVNSSGAHPRPPRALVGHLLTLNPRGGAFEILSLPRDRFTYPRDDLGAFDTIARFWSRTWQRSQTRQFAISRNSRTWCLLQDRRTALKNK